MVKLTSAGGSDVTLNGSETPPIDLKVLTAFLDPSISPFIHVAAAVDWAVAANYGVLNTEKTYLPTRYYSILNEGSVKNTNTTVLPGSDNLGHNAFFLYGGGSVTNATGASLEQSSADDDIGAIHF